MCVCGKGVNGELKAGQCSTDKYEYMQTVTFITVLESPILKLNIIINPFHATALF